MYSLSLFLLCAIVHLAGSLTDIFSSLGFEKFKSSKMSVKEGNKIWQDKNGNFSEKKAVGAMVAVAAFQVFCFFVLPSDVGLFANAFVLIIGIVRAGFGYQNFSVKRKIKKQMEHDAAVKKLQANAPQPVDPNAVTLSTKPAGWFCR